MFEHVRTQKLTSCFLGKKTCKTYFPFLLYNIFCYKIMVVLSMLFMIPCFRWQYNEPCVSKGWASQCFYLYKVGPFTRYSISGVMTDPYKWPKVNVFSWAYFTLLIGAPIAPFITDFLGHPCMFSIGPQAQTHHPMVEHETDFWFSPEGGAPTANSWLLCRGMLGFTNSMRFPDVLMC